MFFFRGFWRGFLCCGGVFFGTEEVNVFSGFTFWTWTLDSCLVLSFSSTTKSFFNFCSPPAAACLVLSSCANAAFLFLCVECAILRGRLLLLLPLAGILWWLTILPAGWGPPNWRWAWGRSLFWAKAAFLLMTFLAAREGWRFGWGPWGRGRLRGCWGSLWVGGWTGRLGWCLGPLLLYNLDKRQ